MTQYPQTQPVQTPEQQPGLLRRGVEAVRGMPWAMGAEMTAHTAADKAPSRAELTAIVATGALALGTAGATPAGAEGSSASASQAEISAADGSREVVRTSLESKPILTNMRFIWKNKNGKRVPTKKMRATVSDSPGHPGDWDLSPAPFLDKPVEIEVYQVNRPKGSKKPRKKSSSIATVTMPSNYTRHNIFARTVTVKLNRAPKMGKDDWAFQSRENVDPIVGAPKSRTTNTKRPYKVESLGPVT